MVILYQLDLPFQTINAVLNNYTATFGAGESQVMHRLDAFQGPLSEWLIKKGCPVVCGYEDLAILCANQLSMIDNC